MDKIQLRSADIRSVQSNSIYIIDQCLNMLDPSQAIPTGGEFKPLNSSAHFIRL